MPPDDESTLLDIADAARRIGAVLSGLDQAGFRTDDEAQDAIFYRLVVIGEAVKRLSPSFREDHPRSAGRRSRDYGTSWCTPTSG